MLVGGDKKWLSEFLTKEVIKAKTGSNRSLGSRGEVIVIMHERMEVKE
jgi:hypothetical protein